MMRPLRTATTTAALRRTTQRLVFGGGRSSFIDDCPIGDRATTLFTGARPEALGRQHAGGRTPRDTVIANERCYRGVMLFLVHRYHSKTKPAARLALVSRSFEFAQNDEIFN